MYFDRGKEIYMSNVTVLPLNLHGNTVSKTCV